MLGNIIAAGANIVGGLMGANSAKKAAKQEYKHQKEFAQNGIQWKAEDARAAGISPLFAMGAPAVSYAPVSSGSTNPLSGLASAGQDISRAVDATSSQSQRLDVFTKAAQQLQLQRMGLENELLGSQLAKSRQAPQPGIPSPGERYYVEGQPDSGLVKPSPLVQDTPVKRESSAPGQPSQEAGVGADIGYTRTKTGWAVTASKFSKDRTEDDTWGQLAHGFRNRVMPSVGLNHNPPDIPIRDDQYWRFDPFKQEYQIRDRPKNWLQKKRGFNKWEG